MSTFEFILLGIEFSILACFIALMRIGNNRICFVCPDKVKVDKLLESYDSVPGCFYESFETELFE